MHTPKNLSDWLSQIYQPSLTKTPEQKPSFSTRSGIPLDPVYGPEGEAPEGLGWPGVYPFTRGVQPTMYRGKFWTMRQYAGFGTAEDTNRRFHYLLGKGQTGLSVAFDLPTQIGYDSDSPQAEGEVGRTGVAIDSLEDMEALFAGIPLGEVSTSMTINATAAILLALYIAVGEKQGVAAKDLRGTVQNDILKEFIARGTYIYPPGPSMRLVADVIAYCASDVPQWNAISISGYHIREAGSTAVQEIAFTLSDAVAYVEAVLERGLDVDAFAGQLSFFFNGHNDFFEEVAKFRAARRLWAQIMKERFHAKKDRSCMLRFHTQTAGSMLTAQCPDYNVVRVTLQALAAVLGGTQSLHTNGRDEALSLPTEESARIALATQQVIAYESKAGNVVDPLGGSYFVEQLTDQVEQAARELMGRIDALGGAPKAIERGFQQKEIADAAFRYQKDVESQEEVVVGVNRFQVQEEKPYPIHRVDPSLELAQKEKLAAFRARRDHAAVEKALGDMKEGARGTANLMPFILEAVRCYGTVGEISNALREVFGEATHSAAW